MGIFFCQLFLGTPEPVVSWLGQEAILLRNIRLECQELRFRELGRWLG